MQDFFGKSHVKTVLDDDAMIRLLSKQSHAANLQRLVAHKIGSTRDVSHRCDFNPHRMKVLLRSDNSNSNMEITRGNLHQDEKVATGWPAAPQSLPS